MLDKIGKVFGKKKFKGTGHRLGNADEKQPQNANSPSKPVASSSGGQQARPGTFQGRPHTLGSPGSANNQRHREVKSHPVDSPAQLPSSPSESARQLPTAPEPLAGFPVQSSSAETPAAVSEPLREPSDPASANASASAAASEELQTAFAQLDSAAKGAAAKEVLHKLASNIVAHPQEPKYRRLRLSNPKIQAAVVDSDGGLEFLLACGFDVELEDGTEGSPGNAFAVLPEDADLQPLRAAVSLLGAVQTDAAAGSTSSGANEPAVANGVAKQAAAPKAAEPCDRETKVLLPSGAGSESVADWVYQRSPAELKGAVLAARKKREQSEMLMTRAMREKLKMGSKPAAYKKSVVRVRLPEGLLLQGSFNAGEPVAAIFDWVTDCLADPGTTFELVLPDKRKPLVTAMGTLRQADLLPSVLLIFRSDGGPSQKFTLRPEVMATVDAGGE